MSSTVTVSSKGQLTLPAAVRSALGIRKGTRLRIDLEGDEVRLRPVRPLSAARGALKDLVRGKDMLDELRELRKVWDKEFRGRLGDRT
jgi:AbrB family looped-hinge helix DNA binding protein